jgi:hypothetical protein
VPSARGTVALEQTFRGDGAAPVAFLSMGLARRRRFEEHRALQIGLLVVCVAAVLALEIAVRLAGGSGAFLSQSGFGHPSLARGVLAVHVTVAVATYVAWACLAIASSRRFRRARPGSFSRRHRRIGRVVVAGLCFTAFSAAAMYGLAFAA